jgi:histidyl-tRNA synthetase
MTDRKIYKPRPVSGFPEWLPEVRRVEQQWMVHIRRVFESYGYVNIETPAVEELDVLNVKAEGGQDVDKEIYVIERLHKEDGDKEARLALHFDQTVPLARYTAQHFNDLVFPFKRYQMQKVWRGERPQAGRFREFYQCDIDVINVDNLPLHFDAEMPAVMWEILSSLPGMENEKIQIRVSNRKILMGLLEGLNIENKTDVTRIIDKIDKIGRENTEKLLKTDCVLTDNKIQKILDLVTSSRTPSGGGIQDPSAALGMTALSVQMQEGLTELSFVMDQLSHLPHGAVVADLSIVRGLDYYTGTVYETVFLDDPGYGSICSGGRYDDLAGNYINKHLPGVGISIGLSRLFDRLRTQGKLKADKISPADILVLLPEESQRPAAMAKAAALRKQGYNVETYHAPQKMNKQFAYAEKKGIPYVWLPMDETASRWEVKNLAARTQKPEAEGMKDLKQDQEKNV